jgi:Ras-related protein Rab-14
MAGTPYNYAYIFKYIIIGEFFDVFLGYIDLISGDMGVGKSCLLHQFTEKKCKLIFGFNWSWEWGILSGI